VHQFGPTIRGTHASFPVVARREVPARGPDASSNGGTPTTAPQRMTSKSAELYSGSFRDSTVLEDYPISQNRRRRIVVPGWAAFLIAVGLSLLGIFVPPHLLATIFFLAVGAGALTPFFDLKIGGFELKWGPADWFFAILAALIIVVLFNGGNAKDILDKLIPYIPFFSPSASPTPTPSASPSG